MLVVASPAPRSRQNTRLVIQLQRLLLRPAVLAISTNLQKLISLCFRTVQAQWRNPWYVLYDGLYLSFSLQDQVTLCGAVFYDIRCRRSHRFTCKQPGSISCFVEYTHGHRSRANRGYEWLGRSVFTDIKV